MTRIRLPRRTNPELKQIARKIVEELGVQDSAKVSQFIAELCAKKAVAVAATDLIESVMDNITNRIFNRDSDDE